MHKHWSILKKKKTLLRQKYNYSKVCPRSLRKRSFPDFIWISTFRKLATITFHDVFSALEIPPSRSTSLYSFLTPFYFIPGSNAVTRVLKRDSRDSRPFHPASRINPAMNSTFKRAGVYEACFSKGRNCHRHANWSLATIRFCSLRLFVRRRVSSSRRVERPFEREYSRGNEQARMIIGGSLCAFSSFFVGVQAPCPGNRGTLNRNAA